MSNSSRSRRARHSYRAKLRAGREGNVEQTTVVIQKQSRFWTWLCNTFNLSHRWRDRLGWHDWYDADVVRQMMMHYVVELSHEIEQLLPEIEYAKRDSSGLLKEVANYNISEGISAPWMQEYLPPVGRIPPADDPFAKVKAMYENQGKGKARGHRTAYYLPEHEPFIRQMQGESYYDSILRYRKQEDNKQQNQQRGKGKGQQNQQSQQQQQQ